MKSLFEQFGGTYHNESKYLISNLSFGEGEEHRTYISLLTSGKRNSYLVDIDRQVQERFELLVAQMKDT